MATGANAESQTAATSPTASPGHGVSDREKGRRDLGHDEPDTKSFAVTTLDESDDPKNRSLLKKWVAVAIIGSASTCAACASSIVSALP
jgi:hypothetical protein